MPTIDVESSELERLLGLSLKGDTERLDELLALVKGEVKLYDEKAGVVSIEMKDTNRPDLWSVEGLARGLQGFLTKKKGLKIYTVSKPIIDIHVDSRLKGIRPFIGCCIIRDVNLTDTIIRGLMHLQDKLDQTNGRNRQKTSIGLYDFNLIEPPLSYTVAQPTEISFVPLGFAEKMNLAKILKRHPKGLEYGHIVKKHRLYPILLDAKKNVLSFPPIINSNDLGRVTEETRNLLVEVTGTANDTVLNAVKLISLAIVDRGGKAYSANVHYENHALTSTPDFNSTRMQLDIGFTNQILGLGLTSKKICSLLRTAGFGATGNGDKTIEVAIPCYRTDVMHQVDLIEEVAIAYGYNMVEPVWRDLPTTGCIKPVQRLLDKARELMVGSGFQEILTYTMTSPDSLFLKMGVADRQDSCIQLGRLVEIENPKVVTMTCLRNWLLPSLMEFLSNNKSVEFPQRVFELGKITVVDETSETRTKDEDWLAAAISHPVANFSEVKSVLDAFLLNLGLEWQVEAVNHPSFINGRVGAVVSGRTNLGFVGEVAPKVLIAWGLENPTVAFELNLTNLISRRLL